MQSKSSISIVNVTGRLHKEVVDAVAVEEPLEIKLKGRTGKSTPVSITMRTPGNDYELAIGFLLSEGLLRDINQLTGNQLTGPRQETLLRSNEVSVEFEDEHFPDIARLNRHFYTTSSCGVCGKASIDALQISSPPVLPKLVEPVKPGVLQGLPGKLLRTQEVFGQTGGLHAAALFTKDGELIMMREDVGRHNAVDKLLGAAFLSDGNKAAQILLLSGRSSFELIQKAVMSAVPVVASIGAPSSLAVDLAREHGITLVGFLSAERFNIYSGQHNVATASELQSTGVDDE